MAFDISDSSVRYLLSCMDSRRNLIDSPSVDFQSAFFHCAFLDFCVNFFFRSGYCVIYDDVSHKYKIFR